MTLRDNNEARAFGATSVASARSETSPNSNVSNISATFIIWRRPWRSANGPRKGAPIPATSHIVTSLLAAGSEMSRPRAMLGRNG